MKYNFLKMKDKNDERINVFNKLANKQWNI